MRKQSLVGAAGGLSEAAARTILGGMTTGLTALGSTQATAFPISISTAVFTTVASGTGAILPLLSDDGDEHLVVNLGANALLVYPQVGAAIQTGATNAGFSVPAGKTAKLKRVSSTLWVAWLSA